MHCLPWAEYSFAPAIPPMTPWGKALYLAAKPSYGPRAADPSTDYVNPTTGKDPGCLPPGVPRIYIQPFLFEIVQTPGRVLELFEFDHHIRQIFTDGREHPKDPDHTWMGDSIGRYEGDALVVDTVGLNDKTWIDRGGAPPFRPVARRRTHSAPQPRRIGNQIHNRRPKGIHRELVGLSKLQVAPHLEHRGIHLRGQCRLQRRIHQQGRCIHFPEAIDEAGKPHSP